MSDYETKRDQYIHDHVRDVTLSLHYVFEAAENRIAELEASDKSRTKWTYDFVEGMARSAAMLIQWSTEQAEAALAERDEAHTILLETFQYAMKQRNEAEAERDELRKESLALREALWEALGRPDIPPCIPFVT